MKNAFKRIVAGVLGFSVVLLVSLNASAQNVAEGSTPLAIAPGSPAGSYALSDFDSINLYNGGMNFALPLAKIAGRGAAGHTMTAHIQIRWVVERGESDSKAALYYPNPSWWNDSATSIYSMGFMYIRQASKGWIYGCNSWNIHQETLTRLTFTTPDGTEYELRDQLTNGQPAHPTCTPGFNRGKVFVTSDGTSATFTSDTDISDVDAQFNDPIDYQPPAPSGSGYLVTRDGTRYRIDGGYVTWMRDRNGNKTIFGYDGYGRVTTITDSLNRQTTIAYAQQTGAGYDLISFKGFGGTTRTLKVYGAHLQDALRSGYFLQTDQQLFPELNGATTATRNPPVINAIELPNGKQYHFYYNSYAELARVELPTGGAIEYDYAAGSSDEAQSGVLLFTNSPYSRVIYRRVVERRVYPNGGSGAAYASKMTYSQPESSTSNAGYVRTDQYDSSGTLLTRSDHYFYGSARGSFNQQPTAYASWSDGREYQTTEYKADGVTPLRQVTNAFSQRAAVSWWTGDASLAPPNDPRLTETDTTLLDTNQVSKATFGYDDSVPFNNRNNVKEYDFGGSLPIRETRTTYKTSSSYIGTDVSLLSLPSQVSIYDASGIEQARTIYEYDNYTPDPGALHAGLMDRSNISGLDSTFSTSYMTRGNVTAITRGLGSGSSVSYSQYDIAGNIVKSIDGRGNPTTGDFTDRFGSPDGEARSNTGPTELAGQSSYAFPTLVTNALGHPVYTQYDYYLGRPVEVEDANGVISSGYFNDLLDRPTQLTHAVNQPASGKSQTIFSYDDTGRTITTTTDQNSFGDGALSSGTVYDGFGRVSQTRVASIYTDTTYDALGKIHCRSNPHLTASSPTTDGNTCYDYDSLGRIKLETEQDGSSTVQTSYVGNTTLVTDQAGKQRKSSSDALGRLTSVWEDPNGANYETDYSYDALGNLLRVIQAGLQDRVFSYDNLSRLIKAYNPESGTICYGVGSDCASGYDGNGNLLRKTDARGVTTTFAYDLINRVLSKQYSDGTKSACFQYDQSSLVIGVANLVGRVTNEWTQAGACPTTPPATGVATERSILAYDPVGRLKQEQQCTPLNCNSASTPFPLNYNYDLAGNVLQSTNGMVSSPSVVLTYAYDTANHLKTVSSSWNDADHPATLYSASPWGPIGVTDFTLGAATQVHRDYNNRTWVYNQAVQGKVVQGATPGTSTFNISFSEQGQDTPATGPVTLGGIGEQSKQVLTQAAAAGVVSISVVGGERSTQVVTQNGAPGTGYVTISGAPQHKKVFDPDFGDWYYVDNLGPVSVTVNGYTKSAYANTTTDTSAVVASKLASAFNSDGNSPVTASASGSTVYLTSKVNGTAANYSLTTSCTYDSSYFTSCAFSGTRSGATLTGGQDTIVITAYDTGSATLVVNGFGKSVSYAQSSSTSSVASGLASAFNVDGSSPVTIGVSGSTMTITAKQAGAGTNYGFSTSSGTTSGYFSGSSFGVSPGSGALSGGRDNSYATVYDSGTVSVSVNGYTKSAGYGQGGTAGALAATIASAFTNDGASPVTASASGGVISFTTRQIGYGVNYPLSSGVSYDTANFAQASFTATPPSGALTSSANNGVHDAGTVSMAVNSPPFSKTISYANGDTASSIASKLASAYSNDSNSPVIVSANGSALTVTSKQSGAGTNYGLALSETHDTAHFSPPSFTGPSTVALSTGSDSSLIAAPIYSFNVSSFQPNGNILTVADSVTGTWTYGYDSLNRLKTGNSTAGQCSGMNLAWGYDRFGNRTGQSASGTSGCSIVQPNYSFTGANNRIDGWSYDAAGNLVGDNAHTLYTYDAENRIDTIVDSGTKYIYDAEGRRVAKANASTGALLANYILGLGGEQITELNGAGQWVHSNVSAGSLVATYDNVGTHFQVSDWLGTRRLQAGTNGVKEGSYFSYPFGDGLAITGADATEHHFTGKERDSESGLDNFGARYNSSAMGRFMSADPFNPFALKPRKFEAWISNPQRWNKYTYALNNPNNLIDPDGMNACGTNNDKDCHVTVTLTDRSKDKNGNYNDQYSKVKGSKDYNATATVTVNGKVVGTFLAKTTPSNSEKYATVANGTYNATLTTHSGNPAIRLQPTDHVPTAGPNPSRSDGASFATGILIHIAGLITPSAPLGGTGMTSKGTGISEGCQLICRTEYGQFLHDTGIKPGDGSSPQRNFTVVVNTEENDPDQ